MKSINPNSLNVVTAKVERSIKNKSIGDTVQFERVGYFHKDKKGFNRTVTLKSSFKN